MKLFLIFFVSLFLHVNFLSAKEAINLRIIDGVSVPTDSSKWEWMLSLRQDGQHICGASLIAPTWVVTATHCIYSYGLVTNASRISVMSGSYDINSNETIVHAKRIIRHPSYNEYTVNNDIALIELLEPITNVTPVHLDATSSLQTDTQSWVAGWGNMSTTGQNYPDDLKEVDLKVIDFDTCNYYYGLENVTLTSNMFCSGYMDGSQDSCQGDSGGPLIVADGNDSYALAGIVSFGGSLNQMCGAPNYPGVYTKVQNYIEWIERYTGLLTKNKSLVMNLEATLKSTQSYEINGSFGAYDFNGVDKAFDWAYQSNQGRYFQFQGNDSSQSNIFGWKEIEPITMEPSWYMVTLGSDVDGDGSEKLDWILVGVYTQSVFKLNDVREDGTFSYTPVDVNYTISQDKIHFY
jgi:secreted trypsin-like serine protease